VKLLKLDEIGRTGLNFNMKSLWKSMFSISFAGGTFSKQMAPSIPVTRLYPTDAKDGDEATFDVIFFHGLKIDAGTDYERTWSDKANTILWPQKWLPEDLENIRVFSVSYDAEATKWFARDNTEDVEYIGENLLQSVVT
jgi:hypothetical protein